jgi:hypothetical protein
MDKVHETKGIWQGSNLNVIIVTTILAAILLSSPVFSSLLNYTSIPSSGTIATISPLHVDGRYIKDASNNIVILKGVNTGGGADYPDGMWSGYGFSTYSYWQSHQDLVTAQLDAIKSWGANAIRFMPASVYWINNVQNHRQMVKDLANLLAQRGMYLIYEAGWEVNVGGPADPLPYPPYQTSPDASSIIPSKQAYVNYIVNIATELQNCPNVIIGFWNEPNSGSGGTVSEWVGTMQQAITAVRNAGIDTILMTQWGFGVYINLSFPPPKAPATDAQCLAYGWSFEWAYRYPLNGTNILYQTHMYRSSYQSVADMNSTLIYAWVDYMSYSMNKPVIFGEIGATSSSNELTYFNNTLTLLNERNIGFIAWEWRVGVSYALITSNNPSYTPSTAGTILKTAIAATPTRLPL